MFDLLLFGDTALQHVAWNESLGEVEPAARTVATSQVEQPSELQHFEGCTVGGGWPPRPGDRLRGAEVGGTERPFGGNARQDRVGPRLESLVGAVAPVALAALVGGSAVVGELARRHDHQYAVVLLNQRTVGGNLGVEELVYPAWLKPINTGMADDLVAAACEVHRIELQGAQPLNECKDRALAGGELARRKEHVALGEEAASRRLRNAQWRVACAHLSVTRLRVQSFDCVPSP